MRVLFFFARFVNQLEIILGMISKIVVNLS